MLSKRFKDIFTTSRLLDILELYKKTRGYKEAKELIKSGEFLKQLKKGYIPSTLRCVKVGLQTFLTPLSPLKWEL